MPRRLARICSPAAQDGSLRQPPPLELERAAPTVARRRIHLQLGALARARRLSVDEPRQRYGQQGKEPAGRAECGQVIDFRANS
jgi:hypothetical protein